MEDFITEHNGYIFTVEGTFSIRANVFEEMTGHRHNHFRDNDPFRIFDNELVPLYRKLHLEYCAIYDLIAGEKYKSPKMPSTKLYRSQLEALCAEVTMMIGRAASKYVLDPKTEKDMQVESLDITVDVENFLRRFQNALHEYYSQKYDLQ